MEVGALALLVFCSLLLALADADVDVDIAVVACSAGAPAVNMLDSSSFCAGGLLERLLDPVGRCVSDPPDPKP